jgi:hypothetical protein
MKFNWRCFLLPPLPKDRFLPTWLPSWWDFAGHVKDLGQACGVWKRHSQKEECGAAPLCRNPHISHLVGIWMDMIWWYGINMSASAGFCLHYLYKYWFLFKHLYGAYAYSPSMSEQYDSVLVFTHQTKRLDSLDEWNQHKSAARFFTTCMLN